MLWLECSFMFYIKICLLKNKTDGPFKTFFYIQTLSLIFYIDKSINPFLYNDLKSKFFCKQRSYYTSTSPLDLSIDSVRKKERKECRLNQFKTFLHPELMSFQIAE